MPQHVYTDTVNPSAAPPSVGAHWINTATGAHFLSKGTASVDDWVVGGGGTGGGGGTNNTVAYHAIFILETSPAADQAVLLSDSNARNFARTAQTPAQGVGGGALTAPKIIGPQGHGAKIMAVYATP